MNLNQLYYFKKLAELQHYTKASIELYISQPSLSYSIASLEKELGIQLFKKSGRNVVLTPEGKEFYVCVTEVFNQLNKGVSKLKQRSTNKINIGTIPILTGNLIPKNIRAYLNIYPQVKFDIFTCLTSKEVVSGVIDGVFDLGFGVRDENENDLNFHPMVNQELVVIVNKNHELSKYTKLSLPAIQGYPLITYRDNNPYGIIIRKLFAEQKIVPNIIYTFDEELTISEMVSNNFGIAIIVNASILQSFNLSIIPLEVTPSALILYLIYQKYYNYSVPIKNFIHHLKLNSNIKGKS